MSRAKRRWSLKERRVEIEKGRICKVCGEDWAVAYFKGAYICDACLNPPPPDEYLAEEIHRYYRLHSPSMEL
jgi:hypothetical protein